MSKPYRRLCLRNYTKYCTIISVLFAIILHPLLARSDCNFTSVSGTNFGTYNVFSSNSNTSGVGGLTINCKGGTPSLVIGLSTGQSNTFSSRVLKSGGNTLNYNLYTNAARTAIWGDGTGGSHVLTFQNITTTLSIYGKIPAEQNVMVGSYSDKIIAIVNF